MTITPVFLLLTFFLFVNDISALFSFIIFFTIAKPNPVPLALVVVYGSKTLDNTSLVIPGPLSSIQSCNRSVPLMLVVHILMKINQD